MSVLEAIFIWINGSIHLKLEYLNFNAFSSSDPCVDLDINNFKIEIFTDAMQLVLKYLSQGGSVDDIGEWQYLFVIRLRYIKRPSEIPSF